MYVFEIDRPAGQPVETVSQETFPAVNTRNAATSEAAETEPEEPVQVERSGDADSEPMDEAGAEAQSPPESPSETEDTETLGDTPTAGPEKVSGSGKPDEIETAEPIENPDTESTAASRVVPQEADAGLAAGAAVQ
jgi:hypothetical protein